MQVPPISPWNLIGIHVQKVVYTENKVSETLDNNHGLIHIVNISR